MLGEYQLRSVAPESGPGDSARSRLVFASDDRSASRDIPRFVGQSFLPPSDPRERAGHGHLNAVDVAAGSGWEPIEADLRGISRGTNSGWRRPFGSQREINRIPITTLARKCSLPLVLQSRQCASDMTLQNIVFHQSLQDYGLLCYGLSTETAVK